MNSLFDLNGKTALVTGASGGLGREFAIMLAKAGADVAVVARREAPLAETAAAIEALGRGSFSATLDVTDTAAVGETVARVERDFAAIDILINNAGIARVGPALEMTEDDWDSVLDTNLKGSFFTAQAVAKAMVARGAGGNLINISSTGGIQATRDLSIYCAAKAGLIHLTKTLALELAGAGIRVNSLAFSYIETPMTAAFVNSPRGEKQRLKNPMKRFGLPADLEGPLLLLASDASSYMTGETIVVDGAKTIA
jgi:NAD(P)-dependent dehydrogenase (short-subunit alcohol dehydrogenase family)